MGIDTSRRWPPRSQITTPTTPITRSTAPQPADLSGASPIFSEHLKSRLQDAHYEMSALSIGIQLEQSSMAYYKEQAGRHADPAIRAFFEELADWERGHYEALTRQQESLKDDYWYGAGFSPF